MYRRILVPLDGSAFAEHALPRALAIARRACSRLVVAHVCRPIPVAVALATGGAAAGPDESYLFEVLQRLEAVSRVPVEPALLEGPVSEALHDQAVAVGADLVVMATHGRGPLSRFWLGSIADELARRLPMPALLLRPGGEATDLSPALLFRHVLVPLDGSRRAESVLGPATALGHLSGAEFTLLRVVPEETGPTEVALAEAEVYLGGVAARLRARSHPVRTAVVAHEHVALGILDEARARGADLIALATRGHGGLKRLLLGSVADKVLRGAHCPVLTYRPLE